MQAVLLLAFGTRGMAQFDGSHHKVFAANPGPVSQISARLYLGGKPMVQAMETQSFPMSNVDGAFHRRHGINVQSSAMPAVPDVQTSWLPATNNELYDSVQQLEGAWNLPATDGAFHKAVTKGFGAKGSSTSPVSSVSEVQTPWLPPKPEYPAGQFILNDEANSMVKTLEGAWKLPATDGGFHKAFTASMGSDAKAASTSPLSSASEVQTFWVPEPVASVSDAQASWLPEPKIAESQGQRTKMDGGFHKAYAAYVAKSTDPSPKSAEPQGQRTMMDGAFHKAYVAYGAKSTEPSPVASVSDAQASWLPVPSVSDAQASWLPESKSAEPQGQRTQMDGAFHKAYAAYAAKSTDPSSVKSAEPQGQRTMMDGAFHKAYAAYGAKSTDPSPVAPVPSVSDAQASWLPEFQSAEPQGQRTKMDGAFHKAYAAYVAKSTDPNPVASFSDAQASWLPESKSAEPQGQRTMMDGAYHKAYGSFLAKSTAPNPVPSVSDAQASWLPEPKSAAAQGQRTTMDGAYHKSYVPFNAEATNLSPVSYSTGLCMVASFMLALIGFKKFHSSRKPVQDPLLYTQMP